MIHGRRLVDMKAEKKGKKKTEIRERVCHFHDLKKTVSRFKKRKKEAIRLMYSVFSVTTSCQSSHINARLAHEMQFKVSFYIYDRT